MSGMADHTPLVSVLMPVYNGERYLREAVESILAQTFTNFEFIIIDDGSTDNTWQILQGYAAHEPWIVLVRNENNIGLARSLNKGLALARGEYIARQDADDISLRQRLEKQVEFLDTHPDVVLVGTWGLVIDERGQIVGLRRRPCGCSQIRWSLLFTSAFMHGSVMFRRARVLEDVGYYDEDLPFAEDYDLWSRIAYRMSVANLSQYLYQWRVSNQSVTAMHGSKIRALAAEISKKNIVSLVQSGPVGSPKLTNAFSLSPEEAAALWHLGAGLGPSPGGIACRHLLDLLDGLANNLQLQYVGGAERDHFKKWLGRWYLGVVHFHLEHNLPLSIRLLFKAVRLNWQILFAERFITLFVKILLGPRLWAVVREWYHRRIREKFPLIDP